MDLQDTNVKHQGFEYHTDLHDELFLAGQPLWVAKPLMLDITPKPFNKFFLYLPCL